MGDHQHLFIGDSSCCATCWQPEQHPLVVASRRKPRVRPVRPGSTPSRLRVLFDAQGGLCHYCRALMTWTHGPHQPIQTKRDASLDHVIPRARGGSNGLENLVAACRRYNNEKGDATVEEWRAWRLAKGRPWPPNFGLG